VNRDSAAQQSSFASSMRSHKPSEAGARPLSLADGVRGAGWAAPVVQGPFSSAASGRSPSLRTTNFNLITASTTQVGPR
jgi:hypothetical protein